MTETIENLPAATEEAKALGEALRDLETRAERFGTAMTGALTRAVANGKGLDEILKTTASRLIDIALSAGLRPLQTTLSAGIGTGIGTVFGGISAGIGTRAASVTPFSSDGGVAMPTFLAGRLQASGSAGGFAAADGRAAGAGGGAAAAVPNVTFNVTARDADSFRRSEGQIAAMLTRTVGRGRRGV